MLYEPINESIVLTRATLRANALLYLVLAVQPAITILAFIAAILLRNVPIGRKFGIASILSGFNVSSSHLIHGAALSGQPEAPIRLEVIPSLPEHDTTPSDGVMTDTARSRYRLGENLGSVLRRRLQKGMTYL